VLTASLGISLGAQVLTVTLPALRRLLGTTPLGAGDALLTAAGALAPLAFNEITKLRAAAHAPGAHGRQP
jgi:hypothetical protein